MLIGQDTEIAFKALVVGVVAHALFKSALFMLAGIVDHETGTREISRLGGLRRAMPVTFVLVVIVSLSLAGLPPMFGFLAKETLLATAVHPTLPMAISWIFIAAIVIAAAFKVVQAGLLSIDVFTGKPRDASIHAHEAPWGMLLAPAIPAILSLTLGILPEPTAITEFFGKAAAASYGDKVKVSFALWTGLNIPLALSVIAISLGVVLFWQRQRLIAWQRSLPPISFNQLYSGVMNGIDRLAKTATRTQTGQLRLYLTVIIVSMLGLVLYFGGSALMTTPLPDLSLAGIDEFDLLRILALIAIVGAAMATIALRRDFFAVLALSAAGLGVAVFMAIEPAPDVALVQIVVDILATVILMLALGRLPRVQRQATQKLRSGVQVRNLIVAVAGGLLVTMMTFLALSSRPRQSLVTPFYEANAKALTGASDIVGAIIVDFRALDTLIEITVFSLAGLGIYTLLRFAALKHDDHGQAIDAQAPLQPSHLSTLGIGGTPTSPYVGAMANILLPVALVIASVHVIYGHEQPGDGFTAGVIVSLAVGFKYVVFGFKETRRRLWWLRPIDMIVFGILLVIATGIAANVLEGSFLAPVDFGNLIGLPLPKGAKLSSGFLFEVAIASAVLGSMTLILDTLGRPAVDSEQLIEELSSQSNTANELQEVQT
jgi:multicomponent K+:H+ antiporter subunit A